jgi:hypothetical protein
MLRVADRIADCVWFAVPQPTERQGIGDARGDSDDSLTPEAALFLLA